MEVHRRYVKTFFQRVPEIGEPYLARASRSMWFPGSSNTVSWERFTTHHFAVVLCHQSKNHRHSIRRFLILRCRISHYLESHSYALHCFEDDCTALSSNYYSPLNRPQTHYIESPRQFFASEMHQRHPSTSPNSSPLYPTPTPQPTLITP